MAFTPYDAAVDARPPGGLKAAKTAGGFCRLPEKKLQHPTINEGEIAITDQLSMSFDRFYTYDELTDFLRAACEEHPDLADMESIGKSYEGRDIWAMTLTNRKTGMPEDKPGMYIDGNIHAGEVTGCAVCMYTVQYLLNEHGQDDLVTHLMDTRTFYILPRVNPDGAELYLTSSQMLRSSVRPNPRFRMKDNHLYPEDIDDNNELLTMRVKDPDGTHKISEKDPRLMIPREPDDVSGTYYSLYPEGTIHNYDGGEIRVGPPKWDLDINRNFPADWKPTQSGAGKYPLSEPETRAMVDFILEHDNIASLQAYHTFAGIILRPSCTRPDHEMNSDDLRAFERVGAAGEKTTGYPVKSVYHGFTRDRGTPRHGVFMDWVYEHLGILGYSTELWDKYSLAGIEKDEVPFGEPIPERVMLQLLEWHDAEGLDSFVPWHTFDHPQLGEVELGGFKRKTFGQNTHFKFLRDECHRNTIFNLQQASSMPQIALQDVQVEEVAPGIVRLDAHIKNRGYLPTYVTEKAREVDAVKPIEAEIAGEGIRVLRGDAQTEVEHLEGYAAAGEDRYGRPPDNHRRVSWILQNRDAKDVQITVRAGRAGTARTTVQLQ